MSEEQQNIILNEKELIESSVVKDYLITADYGKIFQIAHYSLEMTCRPCNNWKMTSSGKANDG